MMITMIIIIIVHSIKLSIFDYYLTMSIIMDCKGE